MSSSVKERILQFIDYKGIKMVTFERNCDLSSGYVTSMRKGFGPEKLNNVLTAYPELNRDWLLFGEGEMLNATENIVSQKISERIFKLIECKQISVRAFEQMIGCSNGVIARSISKGTDISSQWLSNIIAIYPDVSATWLLTGHGNMFKGNECEQIQTSAQEIPLIPYTAPIGFLSKLLEGATQLDCEMIPSPIKDAQIAIQVMGESMLPEYMGGDILLLRKVDERIFIEWGMCYILDTHNGVVLKRVMPGKTKDTITCESYNDKYPPFEVKLSDIIGFYKVVMTLRKKTI